MNDAAGLELDNDEDVDRPKQEIMHDRDVTAPDVSGMVLQESGPGLTRFLAYLGHVPLDGAFVYLDAQLQQLTSDTFGAPQWVIAGYLFDEVNSILGDPRFSVLRLRFASPVVMEELPMPAEQGIGLDNM